MVDRERKARQEGDNDTTLERRLLAMGPYDTMDNGITNFVLDLGFVNDGAADGTREGHPCGKESRLTT